MKKNLTGFALIELVLILALLGLIAAGSYYVFVVNRSGGGKFSAEKSFSEVSANLSHEELFDLMLERMLSLEVVSYSVESVNLYSGNVQYSFLEDSVVGYSDVRFTDLGETSDSEVLLYEDRWYFKQQGEEESEYDNQWIKVAEGTTDNVASGSEFIGLILLAPSSWDSPIRFGSEGSLSQFLLDEQMKDGYFTIESSKRVSYKDQDAIKYVIRVDPEAALNTEKAMRDLSEPSGFVAPLGFSVSGALYSSSYSEEIIEVTILVNPNNATLLELQAGDSEEEASSLSGRRTIYNDFNFETVDIPVEPSDFVPFNQYYPTN